MKPVRIGTRGSALALWQANHIRERVAKEFGVEAEIVIIKTSGDQFTQSSVSQLGLKGVFIKELEDALLDRRVDLAVHSMKDVPTEIPAGLTFPAITRREDPRDCLVSRDGAKLASLAARREGGHGQPSAPGATSASPARFRFAGIARQRGYAAEETGRRSV